MEEPILFKCVFIQMCFCKKLLSLIAENGTVASSRIHWIGYDDVANNQWQVFHVQA